VQEGGGKPPTEYNVGTIVGKKTKSLNIIVYATGFKYTDWYKSPIDEVQQIKDNREIIEKLKNKNVIDGKTAQELREKVWCPTTEDFEAAANLIAGEIKSIKEEVEVHGAKNMNEFVNIIEQKEGNPRPDHSISTIYIITHGNPAGKHPRVSFSGKRGARKVSFSGGQDQVTLIEAILTHEGSFVLEKRQTEIIKKKLVQKQAKIIFYACYSGQGDFLQIVADKLGVEAQGFSYTIPWFMDPYYYYDKATGKIIGIAKISRGYVYTDGQPTNPLDLLPDVIKTPKTQ